MLKATAYVAALGAFLIATGSTATAQVPDPVMAAQIPTAGSGHNYIGLATETVNPADGSLDFELPLPTPPGRGISLPLSIHYNSGLLYYLSPYQGLTSTFPNLNWVPTPGGNGPFTIPFLSFQAAIQRSWWAAEGQTETYHQCDWTTGFVFRGLDGVQYPLGQVGASWSDEASNPGDPPDSNCPFDAAIGGTFHGILVTPGTQNPNQSYGQPSMTLTDASGTVYSFAAMPIGQISSYVPFTEPEVLLPQTITDRNGNQMTLSISGSQTGYVDALGRTAVSWSTSQSGGATSSTISISGFGNVSVSSTAPAGTLTLPGTITDTSHTNGTCVKNSTQPYATAYVQTTTITLPNGKAYTLDFDSSFGQINKITYPGGGYVSYTWGTNSLSQSGTASYTLNYKNVVTVESCSFEFDTPAITDRYVSYDGVHQVLHQHFAYATTWNPQTLETWVKTTTVTTTDLVSGLVSIAKYTYGPIQADIYNSTSWLNASLPVERNILYEDGSGNVLETVNKTWADIRHEIGEQTILSNGQGSAKQYCYDSNEQLIQTYEYGFQSEGSKPADPACYTNALKYGSGEQGDPGLTNGAIGPLDRTTAIVQHNFTGASPSTHIVNEPDSVTVSDGSGNKVKQTSYTYDGSAIVSSPVATKTGLASPPGLRGNATSVVQWNSVGSSATTAYTYYETGQVATKKDPCGSTTCSDNTGSSFVSTYLYTDAPSGGNAAGNSNAYLTTVTDPLGHVRNFTYNYQSGHMVSSTDEHVSGTGNVTSYHYNTQPSQCSSADTLDRLTEVDYPDGGITQYCYNDSVPSVTTNQLLSGSAWKTTISTLDGMGHTIGTELTTDPTGPDYTRTSYDGGGHVYQEWNPSRCNPITATSCSGETTWGYITFAYDGLGRKSSQTNPDNSAQHWAYNGNVVSFTDETNLNVWQSTSDGLGRLKKVIEPNNAATYYTYDTLNDLTCVAQDGGAGGTFTNCASAPVTWRPRSFNYDNLGRLLSATNPETGTICYGVWSSGSCINGYDVNGNLSSKTDARGITISYKYDALNRMTAKSSSDGSFTYAYLYDGSDGNNETNPTGRLTFVSNSVNAGKTYFYDSMGRVTKDTYSVPQDYKYDISVSAGYDKAGDLSSLTYPDGRVISQTYNGAAELSSMNCTASCGTASPNYLTPATSGGFDAGGHLVNASMGNGAQITAAYNDRESIASLAYTATQKLWSKQYTWYPNQNLQLITDGISGVQREFTYDNLNRLLTAQDLAGTSGSSGEAVAPLEETEQNILVTGNEIWSSASATITPNATAAPDGSETATTVSVTSGTTDHWSQAGAVNLTLYGGATLTGSVWLRVPSGTLSTTFYIIESGDAGWAVAGQTAVTLTTTWQKFTVTSGTLQNGLTGLNLQVGGGHTITGGAVYDIWGAELSPVSASGTVTNILPASQQYTASSWYPNGVAVSSTTVAAPDGSATAGALTAPSSSTGGTMSDVVENPAQYSSQPVTASVYLRVPSGTMNIGLYIGNTGSSGFNLIGVSNVVANTSWQRFSVTGTTGASTSLLYLQIGGGSPGSIPANQTLDIWGVQMVVGSSPDGYIETQNTTTVTGTSQTLAANGMNESYSYDGFGNIQESGNWSFQQAYTPSNQLSGWSYDAAGNLLTDALGNNYVYDGEGKIKTAAGVNYVYTAEGERVEKSSPLTDTVYFGGRPIARLAGGIWTDLVYGPNGLLLEVPAGGLPTYRMTDHLGSVVGTLNSTGAVVSTQDLGPFGEIFSGSSTDAFVFTGKERDTESGLDYFGARYFGSSMGRMMSPDPIGGNLLNPQSLNKYAYALNNPLTNTDPTGLYVCKDSADCSSKQDKAFEKALNSLRGSKNGDVARAAGAYGAAGKDNGVTVGFAQTTGKGEDGVTSSSLGTNDGGKTFFAKSDVTINTDAKGAAFDAAIGHEGSHVADAQDEVKSLTVTGGDYTVGMPITRYQSEQRAYGVTNAILSSDGVKASMGCDGCILGQGVMQGQVPGVVNQIMNSGNNYMSGGQHMGPNNQGGSVVNGLDITPKAAVPQVPH